MPATATLTRRCELCRRVTRHEELTGDSGRQPAGKRVLICDTCGYVTTPAR